MNPRGGDATGQFAGFPKESDSPCGHSAESRNTGLSFRWNGGPQERGTVTVGVAREDGQVRLPAQAGNRSPSRTLQPRS